MSVIIASVTWHLSFQLGTTCIGMKVAHGIVIAGEKRNLSKLVEPGHKEKVFKVDEHIGEWALFTPPPYPIAIIITAPPPPV